MKNQNQLIRPNQPKISTKGFFSVLVFAMLMLSMSWKAKAQITYTFTGSSTQWLNLSSWSPSTAYAGSKTVTTNNDIAYFNINTATSVGIDMTTQAGTHYLGALYFETSATSSRDVFNSTGTFGTLYFNGASLNGVNNTIIWQRSGSNHYFNFNSSQLNLGLNATDHVIQITGSGGLFIASVITGASKNLEKAGTGSGVLTLQRINTYTGNTTISAGTLALTGAGSIATSPNIIIGSSGRFDVSGLNTGLTLASTQTLKASATGSNTTGTITLGTSKNLTLSAGGLTFTALASTITPALTVAGGASSIVLNSSPITVPNNLSVGTYKLIGKSGSATVIGTPGTLSYTGSSNNTTASVALTNGELVLTVVTLSAPTVTNTTPATNITTTSATLAGNVTSIGSASILNNGSVYSLTATNAAPQISGTGVTQLATSSPGAGTGTFSNNVSSTLSVNAQSSILQGKAQLLEFTNTSASFTVPEGKTWVIYSIFSDYVTGGTVKYNEYRKVNEFANEEDIRIFLKDLNGVQKTDYLKNKYGTQFYRSSDASTVIPYPIIFPEKTRFNLIVLSGDLGSLKEYNGKAYISLMEITN
jgi:autotransporter-associated beta strand protein